MLLTFCLRMKALMAATLILFGAIWIFYSTVVPKMMRTRALSNAMQLEADLHRWLIDKVPSDDLEEMFSEDYALRLGGESQKRNFREMISNISQSSAPPAWPGFASLLIGVTGLVFCLRGREKAKAEQNGDGKPDSAVS